MLDRPTVRREATRQRQRRWKARQRRDEVIE
jgi:hypothetical protein